MEQTIDSLQEMDKLPVHTAVLKNILPSIGIFLMMLIYNYADLFFIGMTKNDYMVSAVISILCFAGAKSIVKIFLTEDTSIQMGVAFTRIILSTMWISGMINLISFTIQSMGTARQATITSLARNGYVGIIAVLVMSLFGNVYVVAAAQPVADVISFIIAIVMLRGSMKICFSQIAKHKIV